MSNNGKNDWGVSYSRITFLQQILDTHPNVEVLGRHDDIVFEIRRKREGDELTVVCIEEYTASLELVMQVVQAFPSVKIIYVGGVWNGYTQEAYDFCQEHQIGLYNAGELAGGLHKKTYWNYEKRDKEGNPTKSVRS